MAAASTENILKIESVEKLDENGLYEVDLETDLKRTENTPEYPKSRLPIIYKTSFVILLYAYFIWATWYYINTPGLSLGQTACTGYGFLLILICFITYGICYSYFLKPYALPVLKTTVYKPIRKRLSKIKYGSQLFFMLALLAILAFLGVDASDEPTRLIPLSGLFIFLLIGYLSCPYKSKIKWSIVFWGLILQFVFGLLTVRWEVGRNIFDCCGSKVNTFFDYAVNGSEFVYGNFLVVEQGVFAFKALAALFFMSFFINILYYYSIMEHVVSSIGEFLQWIMGTSICESVNSASNIFIGMSESTLLLRPYLESLTESELHCMMTSGFASVAGTVLAAYISFGANPAHLITASVMSAPAALCFAKLMFPEIETPKITKKSVQIIKLPYDSVLDAACQGASDAFHLVANIIASLVAFIAFVYFVNGVLSWMGMLVGFTEPQDYWTIEMITGKVFIPISYVMGVPWEECEKVGQLIGIKTMVNEFAAFQRMGMMELSERSKVIATYSICGFSNPGSIGITISTLGTLIPFASNLQYGWILNDWNE